MENLGSILITGGGAPGAPGIIKAIQSAAPKLKIYSCDLLEQTAGKILASDYFTVPRGDDPSYIRTLLDLCIQKKISTVLQLLLKSSSRSLRQKHSLPGME
jgi:hypothetical protein